MKISLFNYTRDALETLIYTKSTRLQSIQSMADIKAWPEEEKLAHLAYMRDTIQSSWEFVDYHFHISGVTRAFTHQLVRTRTASFAQESMRTVEVNADNVLDTTDRHPAYEAVVEHLGGAYRQMLEDGVPVQDARGILPTNILTSIIIKVSLRTLHDMALVRLCYRTQGEYQKAFRMMRDLVIYQHPWAKDFMKVHCAWYATCAFPRYEECPIQYITLDRNNLVREAIEDAWENTAHEAVPVARDGRTM